MENRDYKSKIRKIETNNIKKSPFRHTAILMICIQITVSVLKIIRKTIIIKGCEIDVRDVYIQKSPIHYSMNRTL